MKKQTGRPVINLAGKRFGQRVVIERASDPRAGSYWLCRCDCGKEDAVSGSKLSKRKADSCKPCSARKAMAEFNGWKYRDGKKRCPSCERFLDVREFSAERTKGRPRKLQAYCKECSRAKYIAGRYGVTTEWFLGQMAAQGGRCAICNKAETMVDRRTKKIKNLAIDHEHKSGRPRGVLCHGCNSMLGYARDNKAILLAAMKYLEGDQ